MDFAQLLDEYDFEQPYRGQILEGVILEVNGDEVLVDVGLKRDAIVPRKDLSMLTEAMRQKLEAGARVMAYVLQPSNADGDLIVSINKAMELEDWENARQAMETGGLVGAEVVNANRGGLLVQYGRLSGFVPQSHVVSLPRFASDYELEQAKQDIIGRELTLKFIEIDRRRNRLILSEREARADAEQTRMEALEEGQVIKGQVVSIVKFGAFVDLGGVDGLIHISKLDHQHVNHPGEVVSIGDEVEVLIEEIDRDKNRISLNRVALLPDPWRDIEENFTVGDLIEGVVTNVVDFGAFVQLPNNLQGLVHISKMSMFGSTNPHDLLREGDEVLVRIISIEPERQRIGLSIDDVAIEEQEQWLHNRREESARGDSDDDQAEAGDDSAAHIYAGLSDEVEAQAQAEESAEAQAEEPAEAQAEEPAEAELEQPAEAQAEEPAEAEVEQPAEAQAEEPAEAEESGVTVDDEPQRA
ncbi:MAG: S1 RNA-binding domain-containing protein [Anaerolineaceae bacterium]|nr:MAG: S1 RNA-binding domain-containing protein [Anaerolineaceae bacterium]